MKLQTASLLLAVTGLGCIRLCIERYSLFGSGNQDQPPRPTSIRTGADPVVYNQPTDFNGAFSSQNDTTGGNGNFATVCDDFTLAGTGTTNITNVGWVGSYFNPPTQGNITAFMVTFYNNNGGIPG